MTWGIAAGVVAAVAFTALVAIIHRMPDVPFDMGKKPPSIWRPGHKRFGDWPQAAPAKAKVPAKPGKWPDDIDDEDDYRGLAV